MIIYILLIGIPIILLYIFCIPFRIFFKKPFSTLKYFISDLRLFFKHKEYNFFEMGNIVGFVGLFGKGKTLSMTHYSINYYNKYNNKIVWDRDRQKFVTQKVLLLSNVDFPNVPFLHLESLKQIIDVAEINRDFDEKNNTRTCTLAIMDEASTQMNSRNFKTNIDPLFLNTILTCRHHNITLFYTAQRFGHVDALLRQVTSYIVDCNKIWRFQVLKDFDAWEMENAQNTLMIKPLRQYGFLVLDKDYKNYDTRAVVDNLSHDVKNGNMLSEEEILNIQNSQPLNSDVINPSLHFQNIKRRQNRNIKK